LPEFKDPVRAYEFVGEGRKVTIAWCWRGATKVGIPVKAARVERINIAGDTMAVPARDGAVELDVDENPVYISE